MDISLVLLTILFMAIVLSVLVLVHEAGHYFAAKLVGVWVHEFGLGYPPLAAKLFKRAETTFTLNWIPFGGFVKLEGEDEAFESRQPRAAAPHAFYAQPAPQRLLVLYAGALANFLLGILIFAGIYSAIGIPTATDRPLIGEIAPGSPAEMAGLPTSVEIIAIESAAGRVGVSNRAQTIELIESVRGETITLVTSGPCTPDGCQELAQEFEVYIRTPEETPSDQGSLGVVFQIEQFVHYPWYEMPIRGVVQGFRHTIWVTGVTLQELGSMMRNLVGNGQIPTELSGPVGITYQSYKYDVFRQGPMAILNFMAILSIGLGIFNVLPLPALDGGRGLLVMSEWVFGKNRVAKVESHIHYSGFLLLLILIGLITLKDIFFIFVP